MRPFLPAQTLAVEKIRRANFCSAALRRSISGAKDRRLRHTQSRRCQGRGGEPTKAAHDRGHVDPQVHAGDPIRLRSFRQRVSRLRHCAVLKASYNYYPTTATFDYRWSILTRIRGGSEGPITMLQTLRETLMLSSKDSLARAFLRLGWQIADPARRPSEFEIRRVAWIGVAASAVGILFSMLVILFEVVQLLIYFLRAPQAGVPAIQTTGGGQATWVSAADMMNLLALTLGLFGELTILVFSIWLLFRSMMASIEFPYAGNEE